MVMEHLVFYLHKYNMESLPPIHTQNLIFINLCVLVYKVETEMLTS